MIGVSAFKTRKQPSTYTFKGRAGLADGRVEGVRLLVRGRIPNVLADGWQLTCAHWRTVFL
jgi:hypothetical protein